MKIIGFTLALATCIGLFGCKKPSAPTEDSPIAVADGQNHDHGDGSHDHSIKGHSHGAGPHDGTIADWGGGKFHVEFTVDHEKQQATVYILGSDEKTPTPIDAMSIELSLKDPETQVSLQALPQDGDAEGKASRFVGTHESFGVVQEYAGTLTGVVDGTPYSGDFKEESHGDHAP